MKASRFAILAIALPVVIMLGWWLRLHQVVGRGDLLAFSVVGYDPRDLLAGHYLIYRVEYDKAVCENASNGQQCVCFDATTSSVTWNGKCDARPPNCGRYLRGTCNGQRFEAGIERYYIAESSAPQLQTIPEKSFIVVALDGNGGGIVRDFIVDGLPLADWVRQQPQATP